MKDIIIEQGIEKCLDNGMTDKREIISMVVEALGVPRPRVRRVKRGLVEKYKARAEILNPLVLGAQKKMSQLTA